jgi:hypothetical protein
VTAEGITVRERRDLAGLQVSMEATPARRRDFRFNNGRNHMLKRRAVLSIAVLATLFSGTVNSTFAADKMSKGQVHFKVLIENISDKNGLTAQDGSKYRFGLSPGVYTLGKNAESLFKDGAKASAAIESMAEDGKIDLFKGVSGKFEIPVGADKPAPIFEGGSYEFKFSASKGARLNFVTMFGPSNDLFYAPRQAIDLFDAKGNPITGDVTDKFLLWDAGTEVNQPPGIGPDQAPLQKAPKTGAREHGVVHMVNDGFTYPKTTSVMRVTISVQ